LQGTQKPTLQKSLPCTNAQVTLYDWTQTHIIDGRGEGQRKTGGCQNTGGRSTNSRISASPNDGGTLLTIASGVVYVADKKNFSLPLLATGAGLATVGYFWGKQSAKGITIGKNKYSLQYINISTKENEATKR
jgi:hypothetical protein